MPTQSDMNKDSVIYRAILEYDVQPTKSVPNPNYDSRANYATPDYRKKEMWRPNHDVPDGPMVVRERMIGPYQNITPIKAYVTRNRGKFISKGLRIKRIEKVSEWEEVTTY